MINNLSDLNFYDYFKLKNSNYNLRAYTLQIEANYYFKTKQLNSSYFIRVINPWNALPSNIVHSSTLAISKFKIRKNYDTKYLH